MPQNYYPQSGQDFPDYPVEIAATQDSMTEDFFNNKYKDIYNRIDWVKTQISNNNINYDKLIENLNNNVGGNVTGDAAPTYNNTSIIINGDTHHLGLEKLDQQISTNITSISTNTNNITSNLSKIINVSDKLDPAATDPQTFNYNNNNFIVDGETIKSIIEKYDRYFLGIRRIAEYDFAYTVENWTNYVSETNNVFFSNYDTFYDQSKIDQALTTASIDVEQREATGADTFVCWRQDSQAGQDITHVLFRWNAIGAIEIRYHCNGVTDWDNMEQYTVNQNNFQAVSISNRFFVVKVKLINSDSKLYNFIYLVKGA